MRGTELHGNSVPQSEDPYISINSSYRAFEGDPKRDKKRLGTQGRR